MTYVIIGNNYVIITHVIIGCNEYDNVIIGNNGRSLRSCRPCATFRYSRCQDADMDRRQDAATRAYTGQWQAGVPRARRNRAYYHLVCVGFGVSSV